MALDTLTNVKQTLEITGTEDDAVLEQLQDSADAFIASYCGRDFAGGTFTEYHPGGYRFVFLKNYPVATVTSVKVDPLGDFPAESLRDPASYIVQQDRGVIINRRGLFVPSRPGFLYGGLDAPRSVEVVYTTATGAIPADLSRAYAELIGHWYRQGKTHAMTGQLNIRQQTSEGTVTEYPWGQSGGFRTPAAILQVLNLYRVPAI